MRKLLLILAPILFIVSAAFAAPAQEFYLSPAGDDAGPGSQARPFKSLSRARDAVRQVNGTMTEDVVVYLRGGEYPMTGAVEFGPQDSGRNGHRVIYRATPGETPILTGGTTVTGWTLHDSGKNIYRAAAPGGKFRQLYVGGEKGIRARTPNRESATTFGSWWKATVREKPDVLIAKDYWEACSGIEHLEDIELVILSHWYHQRIQIGGHRAVADSVFITPLKPEGKMSKDLKFYTNSIFYFENALSFVDVPGEWYLAPREGAVFLCVAKGSDPNNLRVTVPRTETLVAMRGTADDPVEDIVFEGITFECSTWISPSGQGLNVTQFVQPVQIKRTWENSDNPMGIIRAEHARRIAFRNNVIRNAGAHGIQFFADVDDTDIEGNDIHQIAANAIEIDTHGMTNPAPDQQSTGVAIWNNHIARAGQDYTNGGGIFAGNVRGLIVEHNLIEDMPYSGMQIGQQPGGIKPVGCEDNRIRYNHIHHCVQLHDDGGGIYTLGGIQKGTVIAGNYLHDIAPGEWAGSYPIDLIYLDNSSSEILVKDNVVNGGKAAERNGSKGSTLLNNTQSDPAVESNAGIKPGYNPREN